MKQKENPKELRCHGTNRRGRICSQLLFKYSVDGDEIIIVCKCPSCNGFNTLAIKLVPEKNNK